MKFFFSLALTIALPFISCAQNPDISGTWSGEADLGTVKLRIVFHFEQDGGLYTGTMDSPDQGAEGIQLTKVILESRNLTVEIASLNFVYNGTVKAGRINGSFMQSGHTFPLGLAKGDIALNRPQEPLPPYPYRVEEVRFENDRDKVTLAGTLTLPAEPGIYPAVIMVTGSGPQNRDEEIFGHKPFLVIADHLTRNGIAVLRYDDRGFAESTGSFTGSTSEDVTRDALAGFDFLRTRDDICHTKIGVVGHSEGGTIAFMMAACKPELAYVVSMAGCTVRGDEVLITQNRDILLQQGQAPNLVDRYCRALEDLYAIKNRYPADYISANIDQLKEEITGYTGLPASLQNKIDSILVETDPWFNYFISHDPREDIEKTKCPVFALNGDKDLQVNASINLGRLCAIMETECRQHYKTEVFTGVNHLFQECLTGGIEEYGQIEQTISPQVLDDITSWIANITK